MSHTITKLISSKEVYFKPKESLFRRIESESAAMNGNSLLQLTFQFAFLSCVSCAIITYSSGKFSAFSQDYPSAFDRGTALIHARGVN